MLTLETMKLIAIFGFLIGLLFTVICDYYNFFFSWLQRHIYGHEGRNIQIFADDSSLAVNPSYINSWLDLLSRTPRVAPFLSKTDPLITALRKVFFLFLDVFFFYPLALNFDLFICLYTCY